MWRAWCSGLRLSCFRASVLARGSATHTAPVPGYDTRCLSGLSLPGRGAPYKSQRLLRATCWETTKTLVWEQDCTLLHSLSLGHLPHPQGILCSPWLCFAAPPQRQEACRPLVPGQSPRPLPHTYCTVFSLKSSFVSSRPWFCLMRWRKSQPQLEKRKSDRSLPNMVMCQAVM